MFVDRQVLLFSKERQDIYLAHEVGQMIPLFERNNTYGQFVNSNKWIKKFMPNITRRITTFITAQNRGPLYASVFLQCFSLFEPSAKFIQLVYMKKHRSSETVSDSMLAFHPHDYRNVVLKEYNKRLRYEKI